MRQPFTDLVEMASERAGGAVLHANDEFFAEKENLLRDHPPVWDPHRYTDRGKWMDGWETRRRRSPGHDDAIVRLGMPGIVRGLIVDTSNFKGNYPESCSVEGCSAPAAADLATLEALPWTGLLPRSNLGGDRENPFPIDAPWRLTHLRLRIFPDGGVARLRVYGEPMADWRRLLRPLEGAFREIDLAAAEHGACVTACSDMFFGSRHNLIFPGPARTMGEGWETRRRRGPGNDWCVIRLATRGRIHRAEVDTSHFKGNCPGAIALDGTHEVAPDPLDDAAWTPLLPRTPLLPHTRHPFDQELLEHGALALVRVRIFPDGGLARLRLWGCPDESGRKTALLRQFNARTPAEAEAELLACNGSRRWVAEMLAGRPYTTAEALLRAADRAWTGLSREDWLEAFRAHPRIGERATSGSALHRAWSEGEQAGAREDGEAAEAIARGNAAYEARFGHIYIVCATGRSATDLRADLEQRLGNAPDAELRIAAEEQRKITRLRLEKLLSWA